jgi:hypothetical protein
MWHRHKTRAWDFLQKEYPGIRKADGKQLKFLYRLQKTRNVLSEEEVFLNKNPYLK